MYKNILEKQTKEFNTLYKSTNKKYPYLSITQKREHSYVTMIKARGLTDKDFEVVLYNPFEDSVKFQYQTEIAVMHTELFDGGVTRYYIKDENLFEFFKNTEVRKKEVESILDSDLLKNMDNALATFGVLGKEQSYTIAIQDLVNTSIPLHIISVLTDDMNYTFCLEKYNKKDKYDWVFNLAINFLFYIFAFPECVIDGVPSGVKSSPRSKVISTSDKVVSHTTVEHGFVRPHFRSGYFRHFNSDYFVNCKGQVRFIAATMVKGKAKTVINK
jgi:hypothetical protein